MCSAGLLSQHMHGEAESAQRRLALTARGARRALSVRNGRLLWRGGATLTGAQEPRGRQNLPEGGCVCSARLRWRSVALAGAHPLLECRGVGRRRGAQAWGQRIMCAVCRRRGSVYDSCREAHARLAGHASGGAQNLPAPALLAAATLRVHRWQRDARGCSARR